MFLKNYPKIKIILLLIDIVSIVIASFLAIFLRYRLSVVESFSITFRWDQFLFFVLMGFSFIPIFWEQNLYKQRVFQTGYDQIARISKALFYGFMLIALILFLLRTDLIKHSRGNSLLFIFATFWLMVLSRVFILRFFLKKWAPMRTLAQPVLVIGAGSAGESFAASVRSNPSLGLQIVGFLDDDPAKLHTRIMGYPVLGSVQELEAVIDQHPIREIYITIHAVEYEALMKILDACKATNLPISLTSPHFRIIKNKRIAVGEFEEIEAVSLRKHASSLELLIKRVFDLTVSALLILLLSPLLILIALAVKLTSKGPVFYLANAIGKDCRPFKMLKFRSMYADANQSSHKKLMADLIRSGDQPGHKLARDQRITKLGRLLRKFSLDELPQLFNVLKGEMSLIGPRPCLRYEYADYKSWQKKRCSVRPGISGLWQVTGRSEVSFNDMIILDLYYIENLSIWLDFKIFLKTIPTVLFGRGAS